MGLLTGIFSLPLAPVRAVTLAPIRGVLKLGETIQQQVEQELNNPANTRRQLEELEEKRQRGEISAEEESEAQEAILTTKIAPKTVGEQMDNPTVAPAENTAEEQSQRGQRRADAKKSTRRRSASVRRRSSVSRNERRRRSV